MTSLWPSARAKFLFRETDVRGREGPLLAATQDRGVVRRDDLDYRVWNPTESSSYKYVQRGDFVISLRSFQGGIEIAHENGLVSPAYTTLRSQLGDTRFYRWLFKSSAFIGDLASRSTGIRQGKSISSGQFLDMSLPVPSPGERKLIADFLDRETHRIDALVDAKRQMINLLEEKRTAIIRAEVAGSHKRTTKLRYVARVKRGQSPRPIDDPRYFDDNGSHGWVRIEDVTRSSMYLRETKQRLSQAGKARSVAVGPGVVLVSIAASVGKPIITDMDCCYHDGFVGLLGLRADPEFTYHWLSLPERFAGSEQIGTQANINSAIVGATSFPDLDLHEQRRIALRLNSRLAAIDTLRGAVESQLALLAEYRHALITRAVTGELDEATLKGDKPVDEAVGVILE